MQTYLLPLNNGKRGKVPLSSAAQEIMQDKENEMQYLSHGSNIISSRVLSLT